MIPIKKIRVESYGPGLAHHDMPCAVHWEEHSQYDTLFEFKPDQWWMKELLDLQADSEHKHNLTPDQVRAIAVVQNLMNTLENHRRADFAISGRPALLDTSTNIFHPSLHAQEQGWRLMQVRVSRMWLFKLVRNFLFTSRSTDD